MKFILVRDAVTDSIMTIRADLIYKIEESFIDSKTNPRSVRKITFTDGQTEFVTDNMIDLLDSIQSE